MIGRILCRLGRHRRSRRKIRRTIDGWASRCSRCGVPMRRLPTGRWRRIEANDAEAE